MYDLVLEMLHTLWEHGISLSALGTALFVLLKQRKVKRALRRLLPWLEEESEIKPYIINQKIIMENQRRIMGALGVNPVWPEHAHTSRTFRSSASGLRMSFIFSWVARLRARAAAALDRLFTTSSPTNHRRMIFVKKWIKPDTLTVIGGALAAAATQYFGITIDPTNIVAAVILLLGYFKAHEYVTVVRDAHGLPSGFRVNSRKFIFTGIAFALIAADEALHLHLGNDLIFTITAAVTGFNYAEGKKDAREAEQEGSDARQSH